MIVVGNHWLVCCGVKHHLARSISHDVAAVLVDGGRDGPGYEHKHHATRRSEKQFATAEAVNALCSNDRDDEGQDSVSTIELLTVS
jgi:hypothetical protein